MSPWPSSCSAPCSPRMVRESIFEVTWKEMRVGKFALIVPVMTSTDGRCVARMTWMPADRAIDVLAGDHHQVGHLVDDDDDEGQRLQVELFLLVDRRAAFLVVAGVHR